ncbi:DNA-binding protein [Streptomyces sp. GLT-R25]
MTAREAHDGADATAAASISDNTIDELRDQLVSLARRYHGMPAAQAYEATDDLRREVERHRDRTQIPVQQQTLMILNGQTAALLAVAAFDLGYFPSARTLARAAAVYGESTRFVPLQAYADGTLAYIAYHSGEPNEALAKAQRALDYSGLGDIAQRRLRAIVARAYAYLGDVASARHAIQLSEDVGRDVRDDLHDAVGGEFGFSEERLAMSNSTTALIMGDAEQAEAEAGRALVLLGGKAQSEQSTHVRAGAAADLAHARLLSDNVEERGSRSDADLGGAARGAQHRDCCEGGPYREVPCRAALPRRAAPHGTARTDRGVHPRLPAVPARLGGASLGHRLLITGRRGSAPPSL